MSANRDDAFMASWTPVERESFFAAIARHRQAAWRVTAVSHFCALVLAFVVATLMAPLFYGVLGIGLDVIHWLVPMPDLVKTVTDTVGDIIDHPGKVTAARAVYLCLLAALPGLVVMALALRTLNRVMREAMTLGASELEARAPLPSDLNEQRFVNVVTEMALAAAVPAPQVLVTEIDAVNAAVFGRSDGAATIVFTTGLLATVNRAEMQAIAAHLVGSIADGDMTIGTRIATTLSSFGLVARLSASFGDREAAKRLGKLLRAAFRRGSSNADVELAAELTIPSRTRPARSAMKRPSTCPTRFPGARSRGCH